MTNLVRGAGALACLLALTACATTPATNSGSISTTKTTTVTTTSSTSTASSSASSASATSTPTATGSATSSAPSATASGTPASGTTAPAGTPTAAKAPATKPAPAPAKPPAPAVPVTDCSKLKCVALTYDDGPSSNTMDLLEILQTAKVPATFFFIGEEAEKYPYTTKRVHDAGIVIGNHTYTHPTLTSLGPNGQKEEVARASAAIAEAGGGTPTLLRPPFDAWNSTTRKLGMPLILWDVDTRDWQTHSGSQTLETIQNEVHSGSIILMHDVERSSVDETPTIIAWLKKKGYTLVSVPTLLGKTNPGEYYHDRSDRDA